MTKKVTICRKWNNPRIVTTVTNKGIEMEMTLDDFVYALAFEVSNSLIDQIVEDAGNPTMWFTKAKLKEKIQEVLNGKNSHEKFLMASDEVINAVKKESAKVV